MTYARQISPLPLSHEAISTSTDSIETLDEMELTHISDQRDAARCVTQLLVTILRNSSRIDTSEH